jgi:hypothetical protein
MLVGYEPLAVPKLIDDELWIVDDVIRMCGTVVPVRMTLIRLSSGDLILYSPTPLSAEVATAVDALGTVRHLIAPNTVHWLGLRDWQRAYPEAITWGVPGLRRRRQVLKAGVHIDHDLDVRAPADWSGEVDQGIVPGGGGFRETYFFHKATGTLILCDLIENFDPAKLTRFTRLVAKALVATRGTTALHVRLVLAGGGRAMRGAIRTMLTLEPRRLIPAHGRIVHENAAERLRHAFRWCA